MTEDSFTEVTYTSWGQRISESIKGIVIGLIFFIGVFPLLFWNEGRAIKRYKTLNEGVKTVISISADRIDPKNDGKLAYLSGRAYTDETLSDPEFGVSVNAIKLKRTVKMYQWEERKETRTKKLAGGKEKKVTTYKYSKVWSTRLISSSGFKRSGGHRNPGSMPFKSREIKAKNVKLDAFILSKGLVDKIKSYEQFRVGESKGLPAAFRSNGQRYDGGYYVGGNPSSPKIGDLKITFDIVNPTIVSLVARQTKNTFTPYHTGAGGYIELLQTGKHSAGDMFKSAQRQNILLTWGIRIGGLLLMYLGLFMILRPLSVVADVIPLFGNIIGMGAGIVSFLVAVLFGITTISIAWIVYRPLLGFSLLTAMLILVVFIFVRRFRKKASSPPPPPPASGMAKSQPTTMPPPPPSPPPPPVEGDLTKENVSGLAVEDWILKGKKEFGAKNYKDALDAFSMAIESNPKLAVAYYNRGVIYTKLGKKESAISDLKVAAGLGHKKARQIVESKKLV